MQIGIFAKTFSGRDPLSVLRQAAAAGFDGVQYNMACSGLAAMPDVIAPEAAEEIASAAAATQQAVFAVSATYNMIHPDPAVRRAGERRLSVIAAACAQMGTTLMTLCTGTRDAEDQWRHHPGNSSPDAWRDLLQAFEVAIPIAEAHGLTLGVEPELANVVNSAAAARRLIGELKTGSVRIVLDPANLAERASPAERRRIIAEAVDVLAGHIVMAHGKDRTPDGDVAAPGLGIIDFDHFFCCLQAAGFSGPVVAHGFDETEAVGVARFLTQTCDRLPS